MPNKRRHKKIHVAPNKHSGPCLTGFESCKERVMHDTAQKQLAFAMGLQNRLGKESHVSRLSLELVDKILSTSKPKKRQVPAWMGCSFGLKA